MSTVVDRTCAAVGLLVTAPLMALCALGIKGCSPGPVLHRTSRAGRGGEPFTLFKLRTMHQGSEALGPITAQRDARVFGFGRFLRRTKLDEVPQLLNVARGEMALVGPRPEDPRIVRAHYDAGMWESLTVRPGLTSPGSLHYFDAEGLLPREPRETELVYYRHLLPHKIALDLVYVRNRSSRYTAEILIRTGASLLGIRRPFRECAAREERLASAIRAEWSAG